jgi:hypothetical protein
MDKI